MYKNAVWLVVVILLSSCSDGDAIRYSQTSQNTDIIVTNYTKSMELSTTQVSCLNDITSVNMKNGQLRSIAEKSLQKYILKVPDGHESRFGFKSKTELSKATIGSPFHVVTSNLSAETENSERFIPTCQLMFPVVVDGSFRSLITVARVSTGWKAVEFGNASLAKELSSKENTLKFMSDIRPTKLLRLFGLQADFILLEGNSSEPEKWEILPLNSAKRALDLSDTSISDKFTFDSILPEVRKKFSAISDGRGLKTTK